MGLEHHAVFRSCPLLVIGIDAHVGIERVPAFVVVGGHEADVSLVVDVIIHPFDAAVGEGHDVDFAVLASGEIGEVLRRGSGTIANSSGPGDSHMTAGLGFVTVIGGGPPVIGRFVRVGDSGFLGVFREQNGLRGAIDDTGGGFLDAFSFSAVVEKQTGGAEFGVINIAIDAGGGDGIAADVGNVADTLGRGVSTGTFEFGLIGAWDVSFRDGVREFGKAEFV